MARGWGSWQRTEDEPVHDVDTTRCRHVLRPGVPVRVPCLVPVSVFLFFCLFLRSLSLGLLAFSVAAAAAGNQ